MNWAIEAGSELFTQKTKKARHRQDGTDLCEGLEIRSLAGLAKVTPSSYAIAGCVSDGKVVRVL